MNKLVKKLWVSALRSGKYKQGKDALCRGNQNGTRHCCLGVLSDIAVKQGVCSRREAFRGNAVLNDKVKKWAELAGEDPFIELGKYSCHSLAWLNDNDRSFKEISNIIQKEL